MPEQFIDVFTPIVSYKMKRLDDSNTTFLASLEPGFRTLKLGIESSYDCRNTIINLNSDCRISCLLETLVVGRFKLLEIANID
jgi:hypothetical protein